MRVRKLPGTGVCPYLLGLLLAALSPLALSQPAGQVVFAVGNVVATDQQGNARTLEKGAQVEEGDRLSTNDGRVQIQFKDGGFVALQPRTQFLVERYRYTAAGDAEDSVIMSLIKGGLRTISGLVGKRDRSAYSMKAAVATIGIRGTDYALELSDKLVGNVSHGAIQVCNGGGCVDVLTGQAFAVSSLTEPPVLTQRHVFLPPAAPETRNASRERGDTVDNDQGSRKSEASADTKSGENNARTDSVIELATPSEPAGAGSGSAAAGTGVDSTATLPSGQAKKSDAAITLPVLPAPVSAAGGADSTVTLPTGWVNKLDATVTVPGPAAGPALTGPPGQLKKLETGPLETVVPGLGNGVGPPNGIPPGQSKR